MKIDRDIKAVLDNNLSGGTVASSSALKNMINNLADVIDANDDVKATKTEVEALTNSGFLGTFKVLPSFTDYNNLTTPGVYHGVYNGVKTNEPFTTGGNRRVTIEIMNYGGHTFQHLEYNDGAGAGRKYFRFLDGVHRPWVEIWTRVSNPSDLESISRGYQVFASGLMMQWFDSVSPVQHDTLTALPYAFPQRTFMIFARVADSTDELVVGVGQFTNSNYTLKFSDGQPHRVRVFALGD